MYWIHGTNDLFMYIKYQWGHMHYVQCYMFLLKLYYIYCFVNYVQNHFVLSVPSQKNDFFLLVMSNFPVTKVYFYPYRVLIFLIGQVLLEKLFLRLDIFKFPYLSIPNGYFLSCHQGYSCSISVTFILFNYLKIMLKVFF